MPLDRYHASDIAMMRQALERRDLLGGKLMTI